VLHTLSSDYVTIGGCFDNVRRRDPRAATKPGRAASNRGRFWAARQVPCRVIAQALIRRGAADCIRRAGAMRRSSGS
jgi:hypothetical protein